MKVALLMGSDSDLERLRPCVEQLEALGIPCIARVLSAHRTPEAVVEFVQNAKEVGVFVCAAGGAAHLAGVVAAHTLRPVIGVPMDNPPLGGLDALLATVQMPGGIPVASVAVGGGGPQNAALLAARILALGDEALTEKLEVFRATMAEKVAAKDARLRERLG
ncbi:MAG TPA: 5-(carboxyamino)imidazole ribonucleotide mutase [Planctomycetota bacterium]|nr:5-(carboxyamino)imidazole ribonucleotide mutase [Planctomycetota bacterium]